jgi:hypothetical protein
MRKTLAILGAAAIATVAVASIVSASSKPELVTSPMTIKVIEHATTDVVVNVGKKGDSTGDILTFHNKVFDADNKKQVGRDQGVCIPWVPGGAITVEGPFYDGRDNVLAITGGKGNFANARGTMRLKSRHGGTEYAFIFDILP